MLLISDFNRVAIETSKAILLYYLDDEDDYELKKQDTITKVAKNERVVDHVRLDVEIETEMFCYTLISTSTSRLIEVLVNNDFLMNEQQKGGINPYSRISQHCYVVSP